MNGISSKPWLRTLSDEKAEAAAELIRCARRSIPTQMKSVDFLKPGEFPVLIDRHDHEHEVVRVSWDMGRLSLLKADRCMSSDCVDHQSRQYTLIEIEDTPSISRLATPIDSVQAVVNRLDYWLDGLGSPFLKAYPEHYDSEISRFLDKLAIAVSASEPQWHTLYVEPYLKTLSRLICMTFYSHIKEVGIGNRDPNFEIHPSLTNDLRAIMSRYTEVRENDFRRENDLRVHIGDTGMMSLAAPSPVELLILYGRSSDHVPLYAPQP